MKPGKSLSRTNSLCGVIARFGLIVSLWQAPIPWIHSHGTNPPELANSLKSCEFQHHLSLFHNDAEMSSDEDFGWHCHWILPVWVFGSEEPTWTAIRIAESGAVDSPGPLPVALNLLDDVVLEMNLVTICQREFRRQKCFLSSRSHFFEPVSRPKLTSVLRC